MSKDDHSAALKSYLAGFILSLIFTIIPFYLVVAEKLNGMKLALILGLFAIAQVYIQLIFFLHLGREEKPRWHRGAFLYTVLVVFIIVAGSIWIMANMNYNMDPQKDAEYLLEDEGYRR